MRSLYSKLRVLTTRMADDGLEYFAFIERPNDGGDHVHQLKLLPFHIVGEQPSRIGGEFEEPAVCGRSVALRHHGGYPTNLQRPPDQPRPKQ